MRGTAVKFNYNQQSRSQITPLRPVPRLRDCPIINIWLRGQMRNFEDNLSAKSIIIQFTSKPERGLFVLFSNMVGEKEKQKQVRMTQRSTLIGWFFLIETVIGPQLDWLSFQTEWILAKPHGSKQEKAALFRQHCLKTIKKRREAPREPYQTVSMVYFILAIFSADLWSQGSCALHDSINLSLSWPATLFSIFSSWWNYQKRHIFLKTLKYSFSSPADSYDCLKNCIQVYVQMHKR